MSVHLNIQIYDTICLPFFKLNLHKTFFVKLGVVILLIDTRVSWSVLIVSVLCLIFPFLADLQFPLLGGAVVRGVENI